MRRKISEWGMREFGILITTDTAQFGQDLIMKVHEKPATVDAYLKEFPDPVKSRMEQIRAAIKKLLLMPKK